MSPILIDGKEISRQVIAEIAKETSEFVQNGGRKPHLVALIVGNDGASETYVANKTKISAEVGFASTVIRLKSEVSEQELLQKIASLNLDPDVDGFIVQLPLPPHISELKVIESIDPRKDVDGFHPANVGRMALNLPSYLPATPFGIIELLTRSGIETEGKHCVVIGRSHIVGSPVSILMARNARPGNCTVTLCHSKTKNIKEICLQADILVAALGKPEFIDRSYMKPGVVVIDVGIHRVPDATAPKGYVIKGDVNEADMKEMASAYTPVPGGVGPMTIVSLLKNTLLAAKKLVYYY
ncbi:MAG: bifunctional 5,10-methylenetetrahydrofolate dehydrogenase/5,10-methenyltetrahydrofolate cyclohydrolase [Bacteroidota bacterium]|jgi:methylenetetrahydrofolate dehydrogenase (NADP+)/methenyltetrahydrofolate cyclohydrolase